PIAYWGFHHPCGNDDLVWPAESAAGATGVVGGYGFATDTVVQFRSSGDRTGEQRAGTTAATVYDEASSCSEGTIKVRDVRCANAAFATCVVQRGPLVSVFQISYHDV